MGIPRWKRPADSVLTVTDLASLVMKGFYLHQDNMDMEKVRGLSLQLPAKIHERIDSLVDQIPGMNKGKFVTFLIEAGIYEFCKAIIENTPSDEPHLFEEDNENHEQQVINEALTLMGGGK